MATPKINPEVESLEKILETAGSLFHMQRGVDRATTASERMSVYQNIALTGASDDDGNVDSALYSTIYGDIRVSPEEAARYAFEMGRTRLQNGSALYEKHKVAIKAKVVGAMEADVLATKSKSQAADTLGVYFADLFNLPEYDQGSADEIAQMDFAQRIGVSMNFSARGSKGKFDSLQTRIRASEYLVDKKDKKGNVIGYELDKKKIMER